MLCRAAKCHPAHYHTQGLGSRGPCLDVRQEALQRNHHGGSDGTLSMVEQNMAASPGFQPSSPGFVPSSQHQGNFRSHQQGFQQQQQQQQAPLRQTQNQQQQQPEQRRAGFDGSRLPEPPDGMQKLRCVWRHLISGMTKKLTTAPHRIAILSGV